MRFVWRSTPTDELPVMLMLLLLVSHTAAAWQLPRNHIVPGRRRCGLVGGIFEQQQHYACSNAQRTIATRRRRQCPSNSRIIILQAQNSNNNGESEERLLSFFESNRNGLSNGHQQNGTLHHTTTATTTTTTTTASAASLTHTLILEEENKRLREAVLQLQHENERLHQEFDNRIILELFEGEGKIKRSQKQQQQAAAAFEPIDHLTLTEEELELFAAAAAAAETEQQQQQRQLDEAASNSLDPNSDMSTQQLLDSLSSLEQGACPIEPTVSFAEALRDRAYWLVGLLVLQSCSGIILAQNESLLANHPVIVYFLTMLVGAGGNAGNQASVRVIRGLALGTLNPNTQQQFLTRELKMAAALSAILSAAGFVRAAVFRTPVAETIAITAALSLIVFTSVCLGAVLPLLLKKVGVDPAHSSTSIQVIMDILGVVLAVLVSNLLLDSPLGALLISKLSFLPAATL